MSGGSGVGTTYANQGGYTTTTTEYVNQPTYTTTEYVNQPGTTVVSGGSGVQRTTYETTNINRAY